MTYIRRIERVFPSRQMSFQRNDFMNSNSNNQNRNKNNNKKGVNEVNNFNDILKKEVVKQKVKKIR